jgi:hypothetical protein
MTLFELAQRTPSTSKGGWPLARRLLLTKYTSTLRYSCVGPGVGVGARLDVGVWLGRLTRRMVIVGVVVGSDAGLAVSAGPTGTAVEMIMFPSGRKGCFVGACIFTDATLPQEVARSDRINRDMILQFIKPHFPILGLWHDPGSENHIVSKGRPIPKDFVG